MANSKWHRLYSTQRWVRLRQQTFRRDRYICQICKQVAWDHECDHIVPHKGDPALFYDPDNLQTLCKSCHSRDKQRAEQAGGYRVIDPDTGRSTWISIDEAATKARAQIRR